MVEYRPVDHFQVGEMTVGTGRGNAGKVGRYF